MSRALVASAVLAVVVACDGTPPPPPRIQNDTELAGFEQAVAWHDAPDALVLSLAAGLHASLRRDEEAYHYFLERTEAEPDRGLYLALAGLFQARMAGQIGLLDRVAWVEDAIAKLDRSVAIDPGISRFIRGATLARLPDRFDEAARAIDDLRFTLDDPASYLRADGVPELLRAGIERAAWQSLAHAYHTHGDGAASADALARSGARSLDSAEPLLATAFSVTAVDGFRFGPPRLWQPVPGVWVARNYDFSDIGFIPTSEGVIAIDAGTTVGTAAAALAAFRAQVTDAPIRAVIITHGHWDHVGGLAALREPGTEVIAQVGFAAERARAGAVGMPWTWFFGESFVPDTTVVPDRLVSSVETRRFGERSFVLHPVHGGETDDALLVELPDGRVVFAGDAFMPYLGAPFVAEGSPDGLLDVAELLEAMGPAVIVHGHGPLTDFITADTIGPLRAALTEVVASVHEGTRAGKPLAEVVAEMPLPESLRDHPTARLPFLLMYRQVAQRLHREATGYWQTDLSGMEVVSDDERAGAFDGLANHDPDAWTAAVNELIERGDFSLALELVELGLRAHASDHDLLAMRARVLDGLRERYQLLNPFKFIIYSQLAGVETPPVPQPR